MVMKERAVLAALKAVMPQEQVDQEVINDLTELPVAQVVD